MACIDPSIALTCVRKLKENFRLPNFAVEESSIRLAANKLPREYASLQAVPLSIVDENAPSGICHLGVQYVLERDTQGRWTVKWRHEPYSNRKVATDPRSFGTNDDPSIHSKNMWHHHLAL